MYCEQERKRRNDNTNKNTNGVNKQEQDQESKHPTVKTNKTNKIRFFVSQCDCFICQLLFFIYINVWTENP